MTAPHSVLNSLIFKTLSFLGITNERSIYISGMIEGVIISIICLVFVMFLFIYSRELINRKAEENEAEDAGSEDISDQYQDMPGRVKIRKLVFRMNSMEFVEVGGRYVSKLLIGGITKTIAGDCFSGYREYLRADELHLEILPEGNRPYVPNYSEDDPDWQFLNDGSEYSFDILCGEADINSLEVIYENIDGSGVMIRKYRLNGMRKPGSRRFENSKRTCRDQNSNLIIVCSKDLVYEYMSEDRRR